MILVILGARADLMSEDRVIEVKAFGRSARGSDLWLEVAQVEEALRNPNFHLYLVENIRQGAPENFWLFDLSGNELQSLLARRREKEILRSPFSYEFYDSLSRR